MGLRVGATIPNMPEEYLQGRKTMPRGIACLMGTDNCPRGKVVLINDSVVVHIGDLTEIGMDFDISILPDFDAIIMNFADIPPDAAEKARETTKKFLN